MDVHVVIAECSSNLA